MKKHVILLCSTLLLVIGAAAHAVAPPEIKAKYVRTTAHIDGVGNDDVWKSAQALSFDTIGVWGNNKGKIAKTIVKAIYNDTHIVFLVVWEDATRDDTFHKPWVWNAEKKVYEQGKEQEDAMALAFEHTGPFTADMLSPVDALWDLWTWKATRTNPVGHALDKTHRYSAAEPTGKAKQFPSRSGNPIWIQRPDDAGESVAKAIDPPTTHSGDKLPGYLIRQPSGSAADVKAKGLWTKGHWTVELSRKLDTGHPDDTAFNPKRSYAMAVSLQDQTGDMDKASPVLLLRFDKK